MNKEMPPMRDGMKWNRSRSMGTWAGPPGIPHASSASLLDDLGVKGGGMPAFSRLVDGGEDTTNGQPPRGRALRPAVSWSEQQSGPTPIADKTFVRDG